MKSKVKAKWVVKIPSEAQVLVKEHDYVSKGDSLVVLETEKTKSYDMSMYLTKTTPQKVEELKIRWENKLVKEGDLLYETGGMFPKKVYAPCSGVFKTIDEFYNAQIVVKEEGKKDVLAPVGSKVIKIENEKLTLEFDALEFNGESFVEGKVWGESNFNEVDKISDLNNSYDGKVILASNLSQAFVLKADVVGVAAIVTRSKKDDVEKLDTDLPILSVDEKEWKELINYKNSDPSKQVLLNSKVGRLLLVLE